MPNSKKAQWATWLADTETLRASLDTADTNEQALARFLRGVLRDAERVESDADRG